LIVSLEILAMCNARERVNKGDEKENHHEGSQDVEDINHIFHHELHWVLIHNLRGLAPMKRAMHASNTKLSSPAITNKIRKNVRDKGEEIP
jgi:hypothetical protein